MKQIKKDMVNWSVVCVNEFATQKELSPKAAFRYLFTFGGIEFLKEHYEAEHLLSLDDTIEDLELVCRNQGGHL
jgi:hypothetical protein